MSDIIEAEVVETPALVHTQSTALTVNRQENQLVRPRTADEMLAFAKQLATSSLVPQQFKGRPGDILVAIQTGSELGLSPIQSLQNISVVNGKTSLWGDSVMALCQAHPDYEGHAEWVEGDGDNMIAKGVYLRKGASEALRAIQLANPFSFSVADAKRAQLWGKSGPWTQYPKQMLTYRCRGFGLRANFADALRGVISLEEANDYPVRR